ncbi:MAG TPA: hypothetical protein VIL04_13960 [Solirubrobacterales bacterium]
MAEIVDPTVLVYFLEADEDDESLARRAARVAGHYQGQAHGELEQRSWRAGRVGVLALHDPVLSCAWPYWHEDDERVLVSAYIPVGWRGLGEPGGLNGAARDLAAAVAADPGLVARELSAPQLLVLADRRAETVTIANDALGAGRLYEFGFPGGRAWSNRLGALALFAGVDPEPDERGWALFAAAGWFMGDATPVRGMGKVSPGTVTRVGPEGARREETEAAEAIVGRGIAGEARVDEAAEAAKLALRTAAAVFPERPRVDLSGGRDSRISAAAAIAAGVDVELRTSDVKAGEADVARELVARAPRAVDHKIAWSEGQQKVHDKPLRERARDLFLLHEGMRYAGRVRGRLTLPPPPQRRASISGHGGEIAHGFYYPSERKLAEARSSGDEGPLSRLMTSVRRGHDAAGADAYAAAEAEFRRQLDRGRAAGVDGPALLDWFYLMDRFPHRSGLAAHTQRITVFSSPSFIQSAFTLTPEERLEAKLHGKLLERLVPAWAEVPYFKRRARDPIRRARIWEGQSGRELGAMLKRDELWADAFDRRRVRAMWRRARFWRPRPEWEQVFERVVCRVAFEDWREAIRRALA